MRFQGKGIPHQARRVPVWEDTDGRRHGQGVTAAPAALLPACRACGGEVSPSTEAPGALEKFTQSG